MNKLSITRGENKEVDKAMDALMDALGIEIPEGEEEADIDASKHTAETYWKWYNDFREAGFNQNQAFALIRDQAAGSAISSMSGIILIPVALFRSLRQSALWMKERSPSPTNPVSPSVLTANGTSKASL